MGININWYKGSLRPYESWLSVGVKYCFLNRVSSQHFLAFIRHHWLADVPETEVILSKALGEQERVTRTLDASLLIPPIDSLTVNNCAFLTLRYCPTCIRLGYHASFHQLAWFDQCLIHDIPLVPDSTAMLHEKLGSAGWEIQQNAFERLHSLYFCNKEITLGSLFRYENNSAVRMDFDPVKLAIVWNKQVERIKPPGADSKAYFWDDSINAGATGSRAEPFPSSRVISDRLHCIHDFVPAPDKVRRAWRKSRVFHPPLLALLPETPPEMVLDNVGYCSHLFKNIEILSDLYRIECSLAKKRTSATQLIKKNLRRMLAGHEVCKQSFNEIHKRYVWLAEDRADFSVVCPRSILSQAFADLWRPPTLDMHCAPAHHHRWGHAHTEYLRMLHINGLLTVSEPELCAPTHKENSLEHNQTGACADFTESAQQDFSTKDNQTDKALTLHTFPWRLNNSVRLIIDRLMEARVLASSWAFYEDAINALRPIHGIRQHSMLKPACQIGVDDKGRGRMHIWLRSPFILPSWATLDELDGKEAHDIQVSAWVEHARLELSKAIQRHNLCSPSLSENKGRPTSAG